MTMTDKMTWKYFGHKLGLSLNFNKQVHCLLAALKYIAAVNYIKLI